MLFIAVLGVATTSAAAAPPQHGERWYQRQVKTAERKVRRCQEAAAYRQLYPLRRWEGWNKASRESSDSISRLRFGFDWALAVSGYLTGHRKVARWYAHRAHWRDYGAHRIGDFLVLSMIEQERSVRYVATFMPGCR